MSNNNDPALFFLVYSSLIWLCGFMTARAMYRRWIKKLLEWNELLRYFHFGVRPIGKPIGHQSKIFWGRN